MQRCATKRTCVKTCGEDSPITCDEGRGTRRSCEMKNFCNRELVKRNMQQQTSDGKSAKELERFVLISWRIIWQNHCHPDLQRRKGSEAATHAVIAILVKSAATSDPHVSLRENRKLEQRGKCWRNDDERRFV